MNQFDALEDYIQRNGADFYDPDEPGNTTPPRKDPQLADPEDGE
jgi:hypothetical protein